jgi:hypothetical protein
LDHVGRRSKRLHDFAALTFDCYGTLIDWEQGILTELRAWAQPAGLSDDAGKSFATVGAMPARVTGRFTLTPAGTNPGPYQSIGTSST